MFIDKVKTTVSLENEEINDIAYALSVEIREGVKSHYRNHPLRAFQEQTRGKQQLLKTFYGLLGQPYRADDIIKKLIGEIEQAEKDREKT